MGSASNLVDPLGCTKAGAGAFVATVRQYEAELPCSKRKQQRSTSALSGLGAEAEDESKDNIYGWREVMFEFCAGKPFVYYSQYVPSPRIFSIAAKHNVKLMHLPLRTIPRGLLTRHQAYRFMEMSLAQWRELMRQMADQGLWEMVAPLRSHANERPKPARLPNQPVTAPS